MCFSPRKVDVTSPEVELRIACRYVPSLLFFAGHCLIFNVLNHHKAGTSEYHDGYYGPCTNEILGHHGAAASPSCGGQFHPAGNPPLRCRGDLIGTRHG